MKSTKSISEDLYRSYLDHLIKGDKIHCKNILDSLVDDGYDIRTIFIDLFQRSMYEVGEMWEFEEISVATEHLATSITESLISSIYPMIFGVERIGKTAIISCVANEYHQLGGRMVADILELNGWDSYFLGSNVPIDDLLKMISEKKPDIVGLSLSVYFSMDNLIETLDVVTGNHKDLKVIVGGQAMRWGGKDRLESYPNVKTIHSIEEMETYISEDVV